MMYIYSFKCGEPDFRYLQPKTILSQFANLAESTTVKRVFGYGSPNGSLELRSAVANVVAPLRGIRCNPEQVLITGGAQNAFALLVEYHCNRAAKPNVVLEDPGYSSLRKLCNFKKTRIFYLPVDAEGAKPIESKIPRNALVFLTTNHQFPTGSELSDERRKMFLSLAEERNAIIVEDDYQAPFTFAGSTAMPLYSLSKSSKTLYVGSFSKNLAPSLRLGFIIGKETIVAELSEIRWKHDRHSPQIVELAMARYIESGEYRRHEVRMREIYSRRWKVMYNAISTYFDYSPKSRGGLSMWIPLKISWKSINMVLKKASLAGIFVESSIQWFADVPKTGAIRLGITQIGCNKIRKGVAALARCFPKLPIEKD